MDTPTESIPLSSIQSSSVLPHIKGADKSPTQTSPHARFKVDKTRSPDSTDAAKFGSIDDLRRENTSLRIKLHEMQAQLLENNLKGKGSDRASGNKGMEGTLVKANSKIFKLENIIQQKDDKIQQLTYEKRLLENIRKDQSRTMESLAADKSVFLKAAQDFQAEIANLKKTTMHGLHDEIKSLKEQILTYEKKIKSDKDLIHKQLHMIKLLDDKNTDLARSKHITLNPLYDENKRKDIYRNKNIADIGTKSELDTIKALNLAFSTDELLEKVLEEQDRELEDEELRRRHAKGEKVELPPLPEEKDWNKEYKNLRGAYIETRFEFEQVDIKLKEEINNLVKKLNETEEKYKEKCKECDMINQVLDHGKHTGHERSSMRDSIDNGPLLSSVHIGKKAGRNEKASEIPHAVHEEGSHLNQNASFNDEVNEILGLGAKGSNSLHERTPEKEDPDQTNIEEQDNETDSNRDPTKRELKTEQEVKEKTETLIKLGQFNPENTFNDIEEIEKARAKRLDSLIIWSDRKSILGIQAKYETRDGTIFEGPKHMGEIMKEKYEKEPWKLEEDDYIAKLRGAVAVTHGIIWLEFVTKKGILMRYGSSDIGKESFNFHFEENEVPLLVSGSFSKRQRGEKDAKMNLSGLGFKCVRLGSEEPVHKDEDEEPKGHQKHEKHEKEDDVKEEDHQEKNKDEKHEHDEPKRKISEPKEPKDKKEEADEEKVEENKEEVAEEKDETRKSSAKPSEGKSASSKGEASGKKEVKKGKDEVKKPEAPKKEEPKAAASKGKGKEPTTTKAATKAK